MKLIESEFRMLHEGGVLIGFSNEPLYHFIVADLNHAIMKNVISSIRLQAVCACVFLKLFMT